MTQIVRGATVFFSAALTDFEGAAITDDNVTLHISFSTDAGREATSLVMTLEAAAFVATWESAGAAYGRVYWSIRTSGGDQIVAKDGEFMLLANAANPS